MKVALRVLNYVAFCCKHENHGGTIVKDRVLHLLKSGYPEFVSGELICRDLGVSRTAIWKHVRALREDGYIIEAQTNVGYRLKETPDRLYPAEVADGLGTRLVGRQIHYYDSLSSTTTVAKELAAGGCPEGTIVLAEEQTGGRGRLGRGWVSPRGLGIWMSLVLRPSVSPMDVTQLTLVTAVALAGALRRDTGLNVGIKWPNDLLIGGKKICGILTEMTADMDRVKHVTVSMGLNVNIGAGVLPAPIADLATSLRLEAGKSFPRLAILKAVLQELEKQYLIWLDYGFESLLDQWRELCISLNCPVTVHTLKESWEGWAEDVNESGALLVRTSGGDLRCLNAGEVSLRPN